MIGLDVCAAALVPYLSKLAVENLTAGTGGDALIAMIVLLGVFWTLTKVSSHLQEIVFFPVVNQAVRNVTQKALQHLHRIELRDYQRLALADIISSMKRISWSARVFMRVAFLMIAPTLLKLAVYFLMVVKLGLFTWAAAVCLFGTILISTWGLKLYAAMREEAWENTDAATVAISDSILNTKLVRFFHEFEMRHIGRLLDKEAALWLRSTLTMHTLHVVLSVILGITFTGMLIMGIRSVQAGTLSVGDFVMLKGALIAALIPLKTFTQEFRQLAEAVVDVKKVLGIFSIPLAPKLKELSPQSESRGEIQLTDLSFAYNEDQLLFHKLNYHIPAGKKVALVGDSGSGKSTLCHLLSGLYKPHSGKVLIDGINVREYCKEELGRILNFIPQDAQLFNASLRHNLTYGCGPVDEEDIQRVIHQVDLTHLLNQLPEGLNSPVGDMGVRLSGGERQRVALGRALLLKPKVLIIDETTHSLDTARESRILHQVFKQIPTVVIISHRPTTLAYVDWAVELVDGNLYEHISASSPVSPQPS